MFRSALSWVMVFSLTCVLPLANLSYCTAASPELAEKSPEAKPQTADEKAAALKQLKESEEYYELLTLFADTLDQIERNYVKDVNRRELMEAAIRGMVAKLDQHSNYIPPEEIERFKGDVESEFGGIGIQVTMEDEQLKVISPLPGTPAYKAGIMAGDRILKIGDKSTKGLALDECVKCMKGVAGTEITITVQHKFEPGERTLTLKRELVKVETVQADRRENDHWTFILDPKDMIGYIRITSFSRHTAEELQEALKQLTAQHLKGLVLDLRFNPGGLLSSAIEVSDMFIPEGRIVSTAGRNVAERTWDAKKEGTYEGFPMVVLVNRFSASASEIVSACLQDHKRAVVIGERTYGKGSVQNIVELEAGKSALKLTTAGYKRPNGKNIHRFEGASDSDEWGVSPNTGYDIKFSDAEMRDFLTYRRYYDQLQHEAAAKPGEKPAKNDDAPKFSDRQLAKALDYLKGEIEKPAQAAKAEAKPEQK